MIETAIYYVCAEALANVAKHSAATRATLSVVSDDGEVTVEVTDDGTGGADPDLGTGLRGIRDRLEAFGGTLTVAAAPGGGTRLSGVVPLSLDVPSLDLSERASSEDRVDVAFAIRGHEVAQVGQEQALPVDRPGA